MTNKKVTNKLPKIIAAIFVWSIFWFSGQALYSSNLNLPFQNLDKDMFVLVYTAWILFTSVIAVLLWRWKINDFSFLRIKNKKVLVLYIIPVIFASVILIKGSPFGINRYLSVFALTSTTFLSQDVLTFGFLQTYLEKLTKPFYAFMITSTTFFIAHLTYEFSIYTLFFAIGALLFGFLRYKTKNIYLLSVVHIAFNLFPY